MSTTAELHPMLNPAIWESGDPEVMVADGSNVKVTVRDRYLVVEDGVPGNKRVRRLTRVPRTITRLVILGRHGYITLEAFRWLSEASVTVTQLDRDEVLFTSGNREGDARVIKAQVDAKAQGKTAVSQYLIAEKIRGQARVLDMLESPAVADSLRKAAAELLALDNPETETILALEGRAAQTYWAVWQGQICPNWSATDLVKVPPHWRSYPGRPTMLRTWETNRSATDPINAMLNYGYKVAETETLRACRTVGINPDLGIIHSTGTDRHGFVLDLMEVIRPLVDEHVLKLLSNGKTFSRKSAHERGNGQCTLQAPLTHEIAGWAADLGFVVREHAARVRAMLMS